MDKALQRAARERWLERLRRERVIQAQRSLIRQSPKCNSRGQAQPPWSFQPGRLCVCQWERVIDFRARLQYTIKGEGSP